MSINFMSARQRRNGAILCLYHFTLGVWLPRLERYNGLPSMEIQGEAAQEPVPAMPWR